MALVTPFRDDKVDLQALGQLIEWQIQSGTDGILVCGSTGEGLLLSDSEKSSIISSAIDISSGRVPILVGCSSCSTREAIELVKMAEGLGANGVLVIAPFYVKPTQKGIIEHFTRIHDSSNIPIIIYNNPGRCSVNISVDTIIDISCMDRVLALKDSNTNLDRVTMIKSLVKPSFLLFSGDDSSVAGFLAHGGNGAISVTANVVPSLLKKLLIAWRDRDIHTFQEINQMLVPISESLFIEPNPIPVKYALHRMGFIQNEIRLPLLSASEVTIQRIDEILNKLNDLQ